MLYQPEHIYHIYNRGNNKQKIFFSDENYIYFLRKVRKELIPYCDMLAYCLMPNHFHFMVHIKPQIGQGKGKLNTGIAVLLRSYTRAIQKQEAVTGSLFQQSTKAVCLNNNLTAGLNHPAICMHYIHQNPVKAGLTSKFEDWAFSSYLDYAGLRNGTLCNKELGLLYTGIPKDRFIEESLKVRIIDTEDWLFEQ